MRRRARRRVSWCESAIVSGMYSSVSLQAKPIIMPWSPAPWRSYRSSEDDSRRSNAASTPCAMSGDCPLIEEMTPQVSASNPWALSV